MVLTVDYGRLPWIALTLACSFGCYGFLQEAGQRRGRGVAGRRDRGDGRSRAADPDRARRAVHAGLRPRRPGNSLLLAGTGVVTAIPLLLFGAAARRLPLTSIGLLQYLAPVLQFAVGVGIRHEPMPLARLLGFALVWIALVVLTADALTAAAPQCRLARSAEAVAA